MAIHLGKRKYRIKTLEKFETIAEYEVEAMSHAEAVRLIKCGLVAYDKHEHPGDCDEFVRIFETVFYCPMCNREADEVGVCWDCDIVETPCGD